MPRVRVLVVDDSPTVRRLVERFLGADPEIEVVGTAANGQEALEEIARLRPDVVTLDVEMPVMDGLTALGKIMAERPVPVVMLSAHTTAGARLTMEALALGAVDFVAKPSNPRDVGHMIADLTAKVKVAAQAGGRRLRRPPAAPRRPVQPAGDRSRAAAPEGARGPRRVDLVVIGASTGGPNALGTVLGGLPADFAAPVVVVQHLPRGFDRSLAEHLDRRTALEVRQAAEGDALVPGRVLVAPVGYELEFRSAGGTARVALRPDDSPLPPGGFRPSADGVMTAAARLAGERTVGVLLTGMGRDGALGMKAIKDRGGHTIAEDESTCVVFGMPRAAIEMGAADRVLPLPEIPGELVAVVGRRG
ncbi:MAG: protein-glutamate methylesterase/protein-glutamine glutaminase [Desulfotomaculales bacterium]